jgi:hypothetical protein
MYISKVLDIQQVLLSMEIGEVKQNSTYLDNKIHILTYWDE